MIGTIKKIRLSQFMTPYGRGNDYADFLPDVGTRGYLISREPLTGPATWRLKNEPGRTNTSHEERIDGWLGMSDNVNAYAHGFYEVIGRSRTHLHLQRIAQDDQS